MKNRNLRQSPAPNNIPEVILKRLCGGADETQQDFFDPDFYRVLSPP
jgi:hypothetical protein